MAETMPNFHLRGPQYCMHVCADGAVVPVSLLWLINSTLNLMTLFAPVLHVLRTASGFIFLNRFSLYYVFFISFRALYHVFYCSCCICIQ